MSNRKRLPDAYRLTLALALTVLLCAAALGITLLLETRVSTAGFIFFHVAVLGSAWFGGAWAGVLAARSPSNTTSYPRSIPFVWNRVPYPYSSNLRLLRRS